MVLREWLINNLKIEKFSVNIVASTVAGAISIFFEKGISVYSNRKHDLESSPKHSIMSGSQNPISGIKRTMIILIKVRL